MNLNKKLNDSAYFIFWKNKILVFFFISIWVIAVQQLSFYLFSTINEQQLYLIARHFETAIIGGGLMFFILLHFKLCVKFGIKYNRKEFIFLKLIFFIVLNAVLLYLGLLADYVVHKQYCFLYIISASYACLSIFGCLLFNLFFNKKSKNMLY